MIALLLLMAIPQDTVRYDFTLRTTNVASTPESSRPLPTDSLGLTGTIFATLADTVGGRVVRLTIDSTRALWTSRMRLPQLNGLRYSATLPLGGGEASVRAMSTSAASLQGLPIIAALFPAVRPGVAINDRWIDTVNVAHLMAGARSDGVRVVSWFAVDRQGGALLLTGTFLGTAAAILDPSTSLLLQQRGGVRTVVQPGEPAAVVEVTDTTGVQVVLSGNSLHVTQVSTITLVQREFRPTPRPGVRRRVPR